MKTLITLAAAAVLAAAATAAATPVYWSPAKMTATAKSLPGPLVETDAGSRTSFGKWTGCVGVGAAKAGTYQGFRCSVAWKRGIAAAGTSTMWLRPRAGGYCVSSTAFASCPLAPNRTDPRICSQQTSPGDHYAEWCALNVAEEAVEEKVEGQTVNLACSIRSALVYACRWTAGSATVRFVLAGGRWTAAVAVA